MEDRLEVYRLGRVQVGEHRPGQDRLGSTDQGEDRLEVYRLGGEQVRRAQTRAAHGGKGG